MILFVCLQLAKWEQPGQHLEEDHPGRENVSTEPIKLLTAKDLGSCVDLITTVCTKTRLHAYWVLISSV